MKLSSSFGKQVGTAVALLLLAGLLGLASAPAEQPLTKDDVTLLLLGSSPANKVINVVQQRGIDFQMGPDLAKKFHDLGASDEVIEALQKAGKKAAEPKPPAPAITPAASATAGNAGNPTASGPPAGGKPNAPDAPQPAAAGAPSPAPTTPSAQPSSEPVLRRQSAAPGAAPAASGSTPAPPLNQSSAGQSSPASSEPVLHTRQASAQAPDPGQSAPEATAPSSSEPTLHEATKRESDAPAPPITPTAALKDPDAQGIQHIIQEFASKEKVFREARNNYTYHQINKVEELGPGDEVMGTYQQEWDILYDDSGKRIEKVTYAPLNTLKGLIVTKEDIEGFRNVQPFVLTSDELPEYDIKYLGHVQVDKITAYVFSIRPKEIEKNHQYFQGVVWVDDRDLQIVKSEGKQVPELKSHGGENLFPRFTTWREQVDGKFWFPTFTMANDTLYFSNGPPVHMKEVIRYTEYKQFKSGVRILTVESIDSKKDQTAPAPPQK